MQRSRYLLYVKNIKLCKNFGGHCPPKKLYIMKNILYKCGWAVLGAFLAALEPSATYIFICVILVLWDCWEAYRLDRRVAKKFPDKCYGKFRSKSAWKIIETFVKIFLAIVLAFMIQHSIFNGVNLPLSQIVAGTICFVQIWSILENMSSCNDRPYARVLQRIMVDKTERHFHVDLKEFKHNEKNK